MNQLATYNLGTVLRETGINADTLRAWERRYNLPEPQRTKGGHRLYSERDIEIIKWLLHQQEDGMRIGQAVKLWRSKLEAGEDPLYEEKIQIQDTDLALDLSQTDSLRQKWVSACLDFDEARAEQASSDAFTRFPPEVAFTEVFLPGIREVGQLWYEGKVTVQQEHFASALLMRRLDALITTSPPPTRSEKMIVACPPKEEHTLSTLLLTLFLRRRGFQVVYLGTNVPLTEFRKTVDSIQPNLIIFAAQQLTTAATLEETIRALASCGVTIGYSGGIFTSLPMLQDYISGEYLGNSFDDVFVTIEALLNEAPAPTQDHEDNPYHDLFEVFEIAHIGVHAHLNKSLTRFNVPLKQLAESTVFLTQAIVAALYLGELDLLKYELSWVQTLLNNRDIQGVGLDMYLRTYANSARETMGEIAQPLVDWLETESMVYAQT